MLGVLAPLGPDGVGRWAGTAGRCGVAVAAAVRHRTPEDRAEAQPAESADGSIVVVGDLRIDNRDELAGALGLADAPAVPDSAFVLAAYERWGRDLPSRLLGDFAVAIVDRPRGGVLLARDHVGNFPLAVHERPGTLAFASTALALTGLEGVGHSLDVRRAAEVLGLVDGSASTFVEGVRWLGPGAAMWVGDAGVRSWSWWTPDPQAIVDLGSPEAHERELRQAFERSVAVRLRSVGRVGAATSGGLDSSSAAATAAGLLAPEPLPTYTSAPPPGWRGGKVPGWDADESGLVLKLAALHSNMEPSFVHVPAGESPFDLHERLWELGAGPIRNPCNLLWLNAIHERAGARGATTLLTGARGNMYFSADGPDWLVALVRRGRLGTAVREAGAWARVSRRGWYRTVRNLLVYPLLPARLQRLALTVAGKPDPLREWIGSVALRPEVVRELDLPARVPNLDQHRRVDARAVALYVVQSGANQADGRAALDAATGVEQSDPTSDRRVLEVAMRQPEWVRRHDGIARAVVRGAMADRLPPEIVHRRARGEQLPDWLDVMTAARAEVTSELQQLEDHPASRELIDTDRLRRLVDRWPDRALHTDPAVIRDYRLALWRALVVSRYLRWFERRAASVRLGASASGAARLRQ
jgi:asparagine synthase (glutamine-hydrolysing)